MTTPKTPKDDLIGKTLGQFEIAEEIGRGGMATVYKARQRSMNRTVAIKVLPRQMLHDPGFYERFEREVDVISHLEHPHILPIYDYGQDEGLPYIAMRYLGGGSLEQRIRRTPVKIDDIEKPLRQVAQALDYAHQQGIIHRDLKPGNIMLDENGNAYLTDFGIARVLGSDLTGSMIIGTPAYMSPEQANGLPVDGRSDIYSLGIVLFEWMTGRGPYQAETPMAVLLKQIQEPMPSIRQIRGDVPQLVEEVINKATAKNPTQRFSSAGELAQAFSSAIHGISFQTGNAPRLDPQMPVGGNITAPIPTQMPPYQNYQQSNTPYQPTNPLYQQSNT
ncbi:MAG TPA: serine/threonine-protein kinase, partial [Aggregatilineales bacterium]|nr:serine/threonine-protein kinase [Aggregatilineales bacterium]